MKQVYFYRFGDIPKDEKSAIWEGEKCIGYEKGVSVYEAHKNINDTYVPTIPHPIAKTTIDDYIYHINYFRGRKYLVTGDTIGNGSNNEPLIVNVKIIREIK